MAADLILELRSHFGFKDFRPGQAEAIQSLLGGRNTLVVMPTGSGKSLIYQLAALKFTGLTLVISPLIALMKDQVDGLTHRGIPATYINSALPSSEQNKRLRKLFQGAYRLVYVAPERLRSAPFLDALYSQKVSLLAVDEAHCISEWGHDFRPDYLHIATARISMGQPLTVALTATATPQVQDDIARLLGLSSDSNVSRIVTGFNRPNLFFEVRYTVSLSEKLQVLDELISTRDRGAVIVYTGTRRDAEEVAEFARQVINVQAEYYHAGLEPEERSRIQDVFLQGKVPVLAATNAFGMGIDRPDVRRVIHYSMPGSLEAYYQEAGRAGRDGQPARASLLYAPQDRALQEWFIENSIPTPEELRSLYHALGSGSRETWKTIEDLSRITSLPEVKVRVGLAGLERSGAVERLGDEGLRMLLRCGIWDEKAVRATISQNREHQRHRKGQLDGMVAYAEANACRRHIILEHFGDRDSSEAQECCDNCRAQPTAGVVTDVAQLGRPQRVALILLDALHRLKWEVGRGKLAQILKGSHAKDIREFGYDHFLYYGRLEVFSLKEIEGLIGQLIDKGYIKVVGGEYPILRLSPQGIAALQAKTAILLHLPRQVSPEAYKREKTEQSLAMPENNEITAHSQVSTVDLIHHIVQLGKLKSPPAVPELIVALGNPDGNVRRLAASALGKIRDRRAVLPLIKLLACESKPQVRQYAVKALGTIRDPQAKDLLHAIARDSSEKDYTRKAAEIALRSMVAAPNKVRNLPETINTDSERSSDDAVTNFLSRPHPRRLVGPWSEGWALDFHSRFAGAEWNRSSSGELAFRLKYQSDLSALPPLVEQAAALVAEHPALADVDAVVPVPPSVPRSADPVSAFANALGGRLGLPVSFILVKSRSTIPQKEMHTLTQKRSNVAGAFAILEPVQGKRLLVLDDLFDSGATLEEITRLLLKSGAANVCVMTLTRTIHSDS